MFTNTKCKHPLEYRRFKYRKYSLSQSETNISISVRAYFYARKNVTKFMNMDQFARIPGHFSDISRKRISPSLQKISPDALQVSNGNVV